MHAPASKPTRMTIGAIRDIIRSAQHRRDWLTGGTREEFKRQQVGPSLEEKIAELQALDIPPRFVADIESRDKEIDYCRRVIERWNAAQLEQPAPPPAHRHVFLGGPVCVTCNAPFVAGPVTRQ